MINPLIAQGLCADCGTRPLQHGPWIEAEVLEAAQDIGCAPEDFADCCDDCFVANVAAGDVVYAEKLAGRPLVLAQPRHVVQRSGIAHLLGGDQP